MRGTAIAGWEQTPLIDGTPTTEVALRDELLSLCDSLKVEDVLLGWREALDIIEPPETAREYLLVLDMNKKLIQITAFGRKQILDASEQYLKIEKETRGGPAVQAVLVSVDSIAGLRSAYPNYYLDTTAFLRAVRSATSLESTATSRRKLGA